MVAGGDIIASGPKKRRRIMDKVVHFEIPFGKKDRIAAFYRKTFGWKTQDIPGMDYVMAYSTPVDKNRMVKEKGSINGGLYKRTGKIRHPIIVIGVASVDAAIKKAVKSGGRLVTPRQRIPNGSYARVADSEGNIIGLADSNTAL
jgi:predicted enzyme related to lactoylglutathione lyase